MTHEAASPQARFDWARAYTRLDDFRASLASDRRRDADEQRRVLEERARELARPIETLADATALELLVVELAGERLAVDAACALGAMQVDDVTPLPWTPTSVLGTVSYRGEVLALLDLRPLLGLAGVDGAPRLALAVQSEDGAFAFGVDAAAGFVEIPAADVRALPADAAAERQRLLRGVTRDLIALLDLDAIAADPRVVVDEAVL